MNGITTIALQHYETFMLNVNKKWERAGGNFDEEKESSILQTPKLHEDLTL